MNNRTISVTLLQIITTLLCVVLLLFILGKSGIGTIGPSVSDWQAQRVAKKNYHLVKIDRTYIKHTNDISYIDEQFVLPSQNPVYRVIEGVSGTGEKIAVFVESNNEDIHFALHLEESYLGK